ncbi:hypothetical protein GCM10011374_37340 [Kocuria dechangensis]|uniref:Uncharacterized protein n=1 Tax=Kocuria dechangensis TaxID=1176249 RepID=A0A917H7F0_9MICC|nr:hypothetical protein [Kocuria dechangensis]GGG69453.1 hypothetical protein GCM10011374_37340 [Kocuria dechangensis]
MSTEQQVQQLLWHGRRRRRRQDRETALQQQQQHQISNPAHAAVDCRNVHRAWDLRPGDCFHGRVIVAVRGVVGLASSPVAVLSFTGEDSEHPVHTRIGAAHPDVESGCDDVWRAARAWVRSHGLREGEAVDLELLRTEVLGSLDRERPA